jgi:hypothetical protein
MIFSVQHYIEDYLDQRNLLDVDQYAVKLANLYTSKRADASDEDILKSMRRVRTVFYGNNSELDRSSLEREILRRLDRKFKKKLSDPDDCEFPGGVSPERATLKRLRRRSIERILQAFKHGIEARAIDAMWESREKGRLRPRPENLGGGLLAAFIVGTLSNRKGHFLREIASGIGFVDVAIILGTALHLVELKVLQHGSYTGVSQLSQYMRTEGRRQGWLVVFDARRSDKQEALPPKVDTHDGTVRILTININPVAPSKLRHG